MVVSVLLAREETSEHVSQLKAAQMSRSDPSMTARGLLNCMPRWWWFGVLFFPPFLS